MRELVWEWLLADGSTVRATLDRKRREESVWVGRRLVSRAPIGAKPEGHAISSSVYRAIDVRVTFDAEDERCTLRRGEDVVAPRTWPEKRRRHRLSSVPLPVALGMMVGIVGAFAVAHVLMTSGPARQVDRLAGSSPEPSYVDLDPPTPPPPAPTVVRRSRSVRSLPDARTVALPPVPAAPVAAARTAPRTPRVSSPPPRAFASPPRPSPTGFTVDVVCDAQGACQGVRPVRLSMR